MFWGQRDYFRIGLVAAGVWSFEDGAEKAHFRNICGSAHDLLSARLS